MKGKEGTGNRERGTGMARLWLALAAIAAVAVVIVILAGRGVPDAPQPQSGETALESGRGVPDAPQSREDDASAGDDSESEDGAQTGDGAQAEDEPLTEEEKREAQEEKLVNAFDDLTDKWMEPSAKGVTMADVDNFAKQFRQVPKARQDECIHRALNLVPDENVMLLAGVLMDKAMDKEIVETVYNDILNRDEDVKKPILQQIFKDKSHPCWADTAWILDVTGELPKAK